MDLSQYYRSIVGITFKPRTYTPVRGVAWYSAYVGDPDVIIRTTDPNVEPIKTEMTNLGLININVDRVRVGRVSKTLTFIIRGTFPEDNINNELVHTYYESLAMRAKQRRDLNPDEIRFCQSMNGLYAGVQIATDEGIHHAWVHNPAEDIQDKDFDPKWLLVIQKELNKVFGLKYRIDTVPCWLWFEEHMVVWNWPILGVPSNAELPKELSYARL